MITRAEFVKMYCDDNNITQGELSDLGRIAVPCDCGEEGCQGWRMQHTKGHQVGIAVLKCDLCGTINESPMPYTYKYEPPRQAGFVSPNNLEPADVCISCCNILAEAIRRGLISLNPDALPLHFATWQANLT